MPFKHTLTRVYTVQGCAGKVGVYLAELRAALASSSQTVVRATRVTLRWDAADAVVININEN